MYLYYKLTIIIFIIFIILQYINNIENKEKNIEKNIIQSGGDGSGGGNGSDSDGIPFFKFIEIETLDYNNLIFGQIFNLLLKKDTNIDINISFELEQLQDINFYIDFIKNEDDNDINKNMDFVFRIKPEAYTRNVDEEDKYKYNLILNNINILSNDSKYINKLKNNNNKNMNLLVKITPLIEPDYLDKKYKPLLLKNINFNINKSNAVLNKKLSKLVLSNSSKGCNKNMNININKKPLSFNNIGFISIFIIPTILTFIEQFYIYKYDKIYIEGGLQKIETKTEILTSSLSIPSITPAPAPVPTPASSTTSSTTSLTTSSTTSSKASSSASSTASSSASSSASSTVPVLYLKTITPALALSPTLVLTPAPAPKSSNFEEIEKTEHHPKIILKLYITENNKTDMSKQEFYNSNETYLLTNGMNEDFKSGGYGTNLAITTLGSTSFGNKNFFFENATNLDKTSDIINSLKPPTVNNVYFTDKKIENILDSGAIISGVYHILGRDWSRKDNNEKSRMQDLKEIYKYYTLILKDAYDKAALDGSKIYNLFLATIPGSIYKGGIATNIGMILAIKTVGKKTENINLIIDLDKIKYESINKSLFESNYDDEKHITFNSLLETSSNPIELKYKINNIINGDELIKMFNKNKIEKTKSSLKKSFSSSKKTVSIDEQQITPSVEKSSSSNSSSKKTVTIAKPEPQKTQSIEGLKIATIGATYPLIGEAAIKFVNDNKAKQGDVAGTYIIWNNQLLVHERSKKVLSPNTISAPGGSVDDKESYYDAAVRELEEEAGITDINKKNLIPFYVSVGYQNKPFVFFYYKYDTDPKEQPAGPNTGHAWEINLESNLENEELEKKDSPNEKIFTSAGQKSGHYWVDIFKLILFLEQINPGKYKSKKTLFNQRFYEIIIKLNKIINPKQTKSTEGGTDIDQKIKNLNSLIGKIQDNNAIINIYGLIFNISKPTTNFDTYKNSNTNLIIYNENYEDYKSNSIKEGGGNGIYRPLRSDIADYKIEDNKAFVFGVPTGFLDKDPPQLEENEKNIILDSIINIFQSIYDNNIENIYYSDNGDEKTPKIGIAIFFKKKAIIETQKFITDYLLNNLKEISKDNKINIIK